MRTIFVTLSMYSKIPVPQVDWDKANLRRALALLPLVGVIIAALEWLWLLLCGHFEFGGILSGAGLTLIPLVITGGLHMDGFCDTMDALSSHAAPERKREILKDPHTGAFAVIWTAAYLIAYFALAAEAEYSKLILLTPLLSRSVGAFAGLTFPSSKHGGILDAFKDGTGMGAVAICAVWFVLTAVAAIWLGGITGTALVFATLLCGLYVRVMSRRQFGGMSGDLAGYLIQICELAGLAVLVILPKLGVI